MRNWLLPEYIEDALPIEARRLEHLRQRLLELYRRHGYRLVMPPMIEYLESLLTGTGEDLDLGTFKLVDQMSGRMMGLRADITPQVARIDAHLLNSDSIVRLCYCGTVVHARPRDLNSTREPLQIGAEIYGHPGIESDLEIQDLLRESFAQVGIQNIRLDVGHVGIFREICLRGGIAGEKESQVQEMLLTKDLPRLKSEINGVDEVTRNALLTLPKLYGGMEVIADARRHLPKYPGVLRALDELQRLGEVGGANLGIDLADLRGYRYHSGVVFAGYVTGRSNAVALGGRYDEVGKAFGRARPATGFSMDLREIAPLASVPSESRGILAPWSLDPALSIIINKLRSAGEIVIVELPGDKIPNDQMDHDRKLVMKDGQWQVRPVG